MLALPDLTPIKKSQKNCVSGSRSKGLIYLAYGWFGGPWWAKGNLQDQGCTTEVMTAQAQGTLQTNAQFYHPKPATELTCWPGHTAVEFANAWKAKVD